MAPHTRWLLTLTTILVGLAGFGLTSACQEIQEPLEVRIERQTTCKVVKLSTATATPVPCEGWYGQTVTRE